MSDQDEALLAELGAAVRGAQEVPASFVEAGRAAFAWRTLDQDLAGLVHDSALAGAHELAGTRSASAALRALTFESASLTVEVEITQDALLGQLVPPQAGEVEVRSSAGTAQTVEVDELGWFAVRPAPTGLFRLQVRTSAGAAVVTAWVSG